MVESADPARRVRVSITGMLCVCFLVVAVGPLWAERTVVDSMGRSVTIEDTPEKIFSGGLNITSTVVKLGATDRLVAVGQFASDTRYSFVADEVSDIPEYQQVTPEGVLSHDPDLVLLTPFTPSKIREQIVNLDVPVVVTREVHGLSDVLGNTRLTGKAIGRRARAQRLAGSLKDRIKKRPSKTTDFPRHRVLYYPQSGVVPGRRTLPDVIIRSAGFVNVAARQGINGWELISPESVLEGNPDWIVVDRTNRSAVEAKLRNDSVFSSLDAVGSDHIKSFWPKYLTVAGPHLPRAVKHWKRRFSK